MSENHTTLTVGVGTDAPMLTNVPDYVTKVVDESLGSNGFSIDRQTWIRNRTGGWMPILRDECMCSHGIGQHATGYISTMTLLGACHEGICACPRWDSSENQFLDKHKKEE